MMLFRKINQSQSSYISLFILSAFKIYGFLIKVISTQTIFLHFDVPQTQLQWQQTCLIFLQKFETRKLLKGI